MKLLSFFVMLFVLSTILAPSAYAIIILPALLLIPVAKIVAVIIGSLSVPAMGAGVLYKKLFGKELSKTLSVIFVILIFLALIIGVVLKLQNPNRPLF